MRLAGLKSLLFGTFGVLMAGTIAGCDNPFDPLRTSDKIQGLTYFDFTAVQEKWDSDPENDGVEVTLSYYNEFGDELNFHDKPHKITIEFWSEVAGATTTDPIKRGSLLTSKTVDFSNSDDTIRIPIESYAGAISIPTPPADVKGYLLVRVFPPQEYPQKELYYIQAEVTFFEAELALTL